MSVGASVGWTSPFLPILQSSYSPLEQPSTASEASWVGSFLALGAFAGTLLFGWLSEQLGRHRALLLTAATEIVRKSFFSSQNNHTLIRAQFPLQTWWLSVVLAKSFQALLIGRFFAGLGAGGVSVLVPLYVAEISENEVRGTLGSFFIFSLNFGTLLMFVAGSCLSFSLVAKLSLAVPVIFAVTFAFLHDTPQHLLKINKAEQAEKSLNFLRGRPRSEEKRQKVKQELLEMKVKVEEDSKVKDENIFESLSEFRIKFHVTRRARRISFGRMQSDEKSSRNRLGARDCQSA